MHEPRSYVTCGLVEPERIIAVGGFNYFGRSKTAEILHIPTNQWTRTGDMSVMRFLLKKSSSLF